MNEFYNYGIKHRPLLSTEKYLGVVYISHLKKFDLILDNPGGYWSILRGGRVGYEYEVFAVEFTLSKEVSTETLKLNDFIAVEDRNNTKSPDWYKVISPPIEIPEMRWKGTYGHQRRTLVNDYYVVCEAPDGTFHKIICNSCHLMMASTNDRVNCRKLLKGNVVDLLNELDMAKGPELIFTLNDSNELLFTEAFRIAEDLEPEIEPIKMCEIDTRFDCE